MDVKCPRCSERVEIEVKLSSITSDSGRLQVNVEAGSTAPIELHVSGHAEPR